MGNSFPIDIVLFGMIAAFLVLRLRGILGKRTGFERPPQAAPLMTPGTGPIIEGRIEPETPAPGKGLPDPGTPAALALSAMQGVDANFDPARFLAGAQQAFHIIVTAYAGGDRAALEPLLVPETYAAFAGAITTREATGETQKTEIRAILESRIEAAMLRGTVADITVRFVSDQVNHTLDREGRVTAGTDAVTEITDGWSFERDLASRDPTWRLTGARSA